MTPGCTVQSCGLRDNMDELKKAGVQVLGISTDKPEKPSRFAEKELLNFTLLSNEDHHVCSAFGVWGEKSFMSKTYPYQFLGGRRRHDRESIRRFQNLKPSRYCDGL